MGDPHTVSTGDELLQRAATLEALPKGAVEAVGEVTQLQMAEPGPSWTPCGDASERSKPESIELLECDGFLYVRGWNADEHGVGRMGGCLWVVFGVLLVPIGVIQLREAIEGFQGFSAAAFIGVMILVVFGVGIARNRASRREASDPLWRYPVKGVYLFSDALMIYTGRRAGLANWVPRSRCIGVETRSSAVGGSNPRSTWMRIREDDGVEGAVCLHDGELTELTQRWLEGELWDWPEDEDEPFADDEQQPDAAADDDAPDDDEPG